MGMVVVVWWWWWWWGGGDCPSNSKTMGLGGQRLSIKIENRKGGGALLHSVRVQSPDFDQLVACFQQCIHFSENFTIHVYGYSSLNICCMNFKIFLLVARLGGFFVSFLLPHDRSE